MCNFRRVSTVYRALLDAGAGQFRAEAERNVETARQELEKLNAESARLARITEDLLRLTSLESENARFEAKSYRLDRQIRDLPPSRPCASSR